MNMLRRLSFIFLCACTLTVQAQLGELSSSSLQSGEAVHFSPEKIMSFAKKVEKTLAAKGARVAIVARMWRPISELPEGMHFTHVGFAVYSEISMQDGRKLPGYAMYNLYQKENRPDISGLVQDYPVDFFAGVAELESGIIIPSIELQKRLLKVIFSPTYSALHESRYSLIANPYTLGRQNCTEFVLDILNAAIYQTSDIKQIKKDEKAYFVAQTVNVNPLKLMLGAMFKSEISLSDQTGIPVTATFEKIAAFLQQYDIGSQVLMVMPD